MESSAQELEVTKGVEEVQVNNQNGVEHIRKHLTLFEANREIYEICSTELNRGHLQTLLSQKQTHRVHFNHRPVIDQYTQYRASDLSGNYSASSIRQKNPTVLVQNVRVPTSQKRIPAMPQVQSKSLQIKTPQSQPVRNTHKLKRSVSLINGFLKKPLSFVKQGKALVSENDENKNIPTTSSEEGLYKIPVNSNQNFSASQSLYLLPAPEPAVHIATLKVKDILIAHSRMKQKQTSIPKSSNNQSRISQFFSSDFLRRSLYLPKSTSGDSRERSRSLTVPRNERSRRSRTSSSSLTTIDHSVSQIRAKIKVPSGKVDKATITDNKDGTIKISYEPKEVGQHEISLRYNHEAIDENPIIFYVDAIGSAKKKVTAYGGGLLRGSAGEINKFTINTGGLGSAKLSVAVDGPSKTLVCLNDNKDGTITVSYLPSIAGHYKVGVSFDNTPIVGSPFTTLVTDQNRQRSHINLVNGSEQSLDLKVAETELKTLDAVIVTPTGLEEPCDLKLLQTGQLAIVFTPREQGEHLVNVRKQSVHINGSPFKFRVVTRDIGDAKLVEVAGEGLNEGQTNTENEIIINTSKAGYGGLSVALEGPGRSEISSSEATDGTIKLSYKPFEPGHYSLVVKYADHVVPGSPFNIKVSGQGTNPQKESLRKFRKDVPVVDVNQECHFSFKLPSVSAYDLSARIHSPQGNAEDASIIDKGDYVYQVTFTPKEVGLYSLSIRNKDIHTNGSPFPFTVGPLLDFGPHKVRCGGPGLIRGVCGKLNEFNVFTREAGAGELSVVVEGPAKPELTYADRKDGSCHVGYKVSEPGEYRISVAFNDQEVPDSPFRAFVMPQTGDVSKIELGPLPPESMIQLNKPCNLTVIMNGAKGNIEAKVKLPSGKMEDCYASPIDAENWGVRFIPRECGVHQVHIKFNKGASHIPQSPVFIRVGHDSADPASILAHGNGLKTAIVNHATDFTVETCNAGHALLEVHIEGPSKVSMGCAEIDEGYKINYTPLAPGDYLISVKYNGCHTGASPYKVRAVKQPGSRTVADAGSHEISSIAIATTDRAAKQKVENMPKFKSDASRIYCKGMGLKKAFAGKPNTLTVNCSEAGFNMIYASFLGATRNTIHEVSIKHLGGNIYEIEYHCPDRGNAILIVKYGDDHVPGSPFYINII